MFRKFLSKFNKKKADHGQDHDSDSDSTMKDLKNEIKERIRQRTKEFEKLNDLKLSFEKYKSKIKFVFENKNFRDELFSKFSDLWENKRITEDKEIYAIITQVSIANAFLAGLPGKWAVGVYVWMALEFYMAIAIASRMGFDISDDKFQDKLWSKLLELSKYVGYFSIVAGTVFYVFRHMLSFVFSLVPAFLPATVIAEYIGPVVGSEQGEKRDNVEGLVVLAVVEAQIQAVVGRVAGAVEQIRLDQARVKLGGKGLVIGSIGAPAGVAPAQAEFVFVRRAITED